MSASDGRVHVRGQGQGRVRIQGQDWTPRLGLTVPLAHSCKPVSYSDDTCKRMRASTVNVNLRR